MKREDIHKVATITRLQLKLTPPISLDSLLTSLKNNLSINCKAYNNLDIDAEASISKEEKLLVEIKYSKDNSEKRNLYAITRELGHIALHSFNEEGELRVNNFSSKNSRIVQQELEANEFALAFLMPEEKFIEVCEMNFKEQKFNVTKIAEYFNVFVRTATIRGNELDLWRA